MILKNNTTPGHLDSRTPFAQQPEISTSVWSSHGDSNRLLFGSGTMPVSQPRRTPGGLVLLKSTPLSSRAPQLGRWSQSLVFKPYAHTLELLRRHQLMLRKHERDPYLNLSIAWMSLINSHIEFNKRTLESFELALSNTLFLETNQPQQSVEALCSETQFDAIVVEAPATPVILKRAQRWLKPTAHDPLKPESANLLEKHPRERLFILIDEPSGVRR